MYVIEGDYATIRGHSGARSLKGILASKKGKGMSFAQVREAAGHAVSKRRPAAVAGGLSDQDFRKFADVRIEMQ